MGVGKRALWIWIWIILGFGAGGAWAAEVPLFPRESFPGGPWRLKAQKVIYEAQSRTYTAEGQVEIVQGDRRLTAEWARVHETTKIVRLKGKVVLVLDGDIFSGQEGEFNLATRSGEMRGARLFLQRNHFRLDSDLIRKTGEHTFYAEQATVTTCDADRPAWSFKTRKIKVVLEGTALARGNTLRLAGLPVFYSPYLTLPVVTKRQTGFLVPNVELTKASGTVLEFPIYWAISNHADATFYQNYLSKRGYMQGVDLRYRGRRDAQGTLRFVYLKDGRQDTPVSNRYWVAGMVDQRLTPNLDMRLTLDRVSDSAFLERFNFGYLGLSRYSRDLLNNYGRQLEPEEIKTRVSTLLISGNYPWGNITTFGRNYQRLRSIEPFPFNQAPGALLTTLTRPAKRWPLMVGLESSYGYFLQEQGGQGHRLDFHPRAWLNANLFSLVSFEGRAGLRETLFVVDKTETDRPEADATLSRELYDVKVSLASSWFKDYGRGRGNKGEFVRHYLRPEVTYWNMPRYNPERLPDYNPFDLGWVVPTNRNLPVREGDNPLGGVNSITYGFSSNLLRRHENYQGQAVVRDVFWFRLLQGVFFNDFDMGLNGQPQPHNRFSDFLGELEIYPFRRVTLGTEAALSPYNEGFTRAKVKFIYFNNERQRYLNVNYLFIKDFANQINVTTYINLLPSVKTWFTFNHTFRFDNKLERRYGIILQRQCWGLAFAYTDRPDDQRISFTLIIPSLIGKFKRLPVYIPEGREIAQRY